MVATPDQIQELYTFFSKVDIPKTITISRSITYNDLPEFIKAVLQHLKDGKMAAICLAPRYWDLIEIRKLLEAGQAKPV